MCVKGRTPNHSLHRLCQEHFEKENSAKIDELKEKLAKATGSLGFQVCGFHVGQNAPKKAFAQWKLFYYVVYTCHDWRNLPVG